MSKEILPAETKEAIKTLEVVNNHEISPSSVIGMNSTRVFETKIYMHESQLTLLNDGSWIMPVSSLSLGLVKSLKPGSIIGVSFGTKEQVVNSLNSSSKEALGIIWEHNTNGTLIFGIYREPRSPNEKRGTWGTIKVADVEIPERNVAIDSLKRLFDPKRGTEASHMLTLAFGVSLGSNTKLKELAHDTHETRNSAIKSLQQNFLLGPFKMTPPIQFDENSKNWWFRIHRDSNGNILPIDNGQLGIKEDSESLLTVVAYKKAADKIALTNPTNMGAGTSSQRVFETLLQLTPTVTEMAENDRSVNQVQKEIRGQLGIRK